MSDDDEFDDLEGTFVNRSCVIVRPRQPYADWANGVDDVGPRFEIKNGVGRTRVYLVSEAVEARRPDESLRSCWRRVFTAELNAWSRLPAQWPKSRTFEMFLSWFDVELCDSIMDLEDDEIERI